VSLDYDSLEAAIKACIVAATGLPTDAVRFAYAAYQGVPRPVGQPFVTMMLGPSSTVGIDGLTTTFDATRDLGEEIEISSNATREFRLYLQAFGGTPMGNRSALAILQKARERLVLPGVRSLMTDQGITPIGPGAVQYVPSIEGTKFESRATLEIRCYVRADEQEYAGYINRVCFTDRFYSPSGTFLTGTFTTGSFTVDITYV
jgi:hypothetical protein